MGEKNEAFVGRGRFSGDVAGHIFFVYTKDDGSQTAISITPKRGFLGMEGGEAKVNSGAWNDSHEDWVRLGEKPAVSMGFITGDNLRANFDAIANTYGDIAITRNYFFLTQNSNAVGSAAADNGGLNIDWSRSPYNLKGLHYYDNKSEVDDQNGHTVTYND